MVSRSNICLHDENKNYQNTKLYVNVTSLPTTQGFSNYILAAFKFLTVEAAEAIFTICCVFFTILYGLHLNNSRKKAKISHYEPDTSPKVIALSTAISTIGPMYVLLPAPQVYDHVNPLLPILSLPFVALVTRFLLFPRLYGYNSIYDILEDRYGQLLRLPVTILYGSALLFYSAAILILAAESTERLIAVQIEYQIVAIGLIVTFYSSYHGLRGVVYIDALQVFAIVILLVILAIRVLFAVIDAENGHTIQSVASFFYEQLAINETVQSFIPSDHGMSNNVYENVIGGTLVYVALFTMAEGTIQRFGCMGEKADVKSSLSYGLLTIFALLLSSSIYAVFTVYQYVKVGQCQPESKRQMAYEIIEIVDGPLGFRAAIATVILLAAISTISTQILALLNIQMRSFQGIKDNVSASTLLLGCFLTIISVILSTASTKVVDIISNSPPYICSPVAAVVMLALFDTQRYFHSISILCSFILTTVTSIVFQLTSNFIISPPIWLPKISMLWSIVIINVVFAFLAIFFNFIFCVPSINVYVRSLYGYDTYDDAEHRESRRFNDNPRNANALRTPNGSMKKVSAMSANHTPADATKEFSFEVLPTEESIRVHEKKAIEESFMLAQTNFTQNSGKRRASEKINYPYVVSQTHNNLPMNVNTL